MAPTLAARVHVDSPQTAVPMRAVEPGRTRHIAVAAPPLSATALQRRVRVVLYFRADADRGAPLWEEAVFAKESLSEALANHPEMGGRLRRHEDGSWEVKLNDAGARFTHANAEASLDDFLEAAKDEARRERWEAALAPWVDIRPDDPDMCCLFYLQVTRFQGDGGFAVGVSSSMMLCDPLSLARFLHSWADTHAKMKQDNKVATNPLMEYACYFRRPDAMAVRSLVKTIPLDTPTDDAAGDSHQATETVLFRASTGANKGAPDIHRVIAGACIGQASEILGSADKVPSQVPLVLVRDGMAGMSVETCTVDSKPGSSGQYKLEVAQWKELGLEELVVRDSKPVHVSYSIVTAGDEGFAVVMPDGATGDYLVTATVTK